MTDAMTTPSLSFYLPRPDHVVWYKGIERLALIAPSRPLDPPTHDHHWAVSEFTKVGLTCTLVREVPLHLMGGTDQIMVGGVKLFQHSFSILEQDHGIYLALIAGTPPFHDVAAQALELKEAVTAVLQAYRDQGFLSLADD